MLVTKLLKPIYDTAKLPNKANDFINFVNRFLNSYRRLQVHYWLKNFCKMHIKTSILLRFSW